MSARNVIVGITHGDLNGIGYEVIMKALSDPRVIENKTIIVYGSPKVAAYHRKVLGLNNFNFNQINTIEEAHKQRPNILNCVDPNVRVDIGKSTPEAGKASVEALDAAVADLKAGKIDVLVTCPINKENVQQSGFNFPGHTEYLAHNFGGKKEVMLMVSDVMRIGVLTGHIPLSAVAGKITKNAILEKLNVLHETLRTDFTITNPRIAVLGLNPHAGDKGVIGSEDDTIVAPAIKQANERGMVVAGPFPADGFFGSSEFRKFDAILAMYHDQGLVPFKALSFDSGVNYTAGLPIIRTSPGHGTAYDIAGKGEASETSLREAIYLAVDVFHHRTENRGLESNKLHFKELTE